MLRSLTLTCIPARLLPRPSAHLRPAETASIFSVADSLASGSPHPLSPLQCVPAALQPGDAGDTTLVRANDRNL